MIISHENEFIFFKPLKSAGSSVELALGNHCGKNDILTGSPYRDEIEKGYKDSNNEIISRLVGQQARNYLINEKGSFNPPPHTLLSDFYINVITEIYNTHTTPIRFFEINKDKDIFDNYKTISIVRNPWDALVSFYWWSSSDKVLARKDGDNISDLGIDESAILPGLSGKHDDSPQMLRRKFNLFLKTKTNPLQPLASSKNLQEFGRDTVLNHFSLIMNEFYLYKSIDFILRFENLQEDYDKLCLSLLLTTAHLPRLKSVERKSKMPFHEYYTEESKKMVEDLFADLISEQGYRFN
jgi:hypothetical protein